MTILTLLWGVNIGIADLKDDLFESPKGAKVGVQPLGDCFLGH